MKEALNLSPRAKQYEYLTNEQAEKGYEEYGKLCEAFSVGAIIGGLTFEQWLYYMEYRIY